MPVVGIRGGLMNRHWEDLYYGACKDLGPLVIPERQDREINLTVEVREGDVELSGSWSILPDVKCGILGCSVSLPVALFELCSPEMNVALVSLMRETVRGGILMAIRRRKLLFGRDPNETTFVKASMRIVHPEDGVAKT